MSGLLGGALVKPRPGLAQTALTQTAVELELVLAVDASSSVDQAEFVLQMQGFARAFRDPDVLAALRAVNGVAVMLMQWASTSRQSVVVPWTLLRGEADAHEFAAALASAPRQVRAGGTSIAAALDAGYAALAGNAYLGRRQVIDLSGDGRANMGARPSRARDRIAATGATINGLAILNEEPALDRYYVDYVIGGPRAFLITAVDYESFAQAIKRKLIREITGAQMVQAPGGPAGADAPRTESSRRFAAPAMGPVAPPAHVH
ncbi:DUF1194 domain-containing protein [Rhodovibrio salinarum]|uniref:DUF1194 domain-containing protein n=1 Tax=Rhodovibrio salinarum TaxID=1087 RepID=UPI0004B2EE48